MRKSCFSIAVTFVCALALAHAALLFAPPMRAQAPPLSAAAPTNDPDSPKDNYLWLEDIRGEKSLAWVRGQNAATARELEASPDFENLRAALLSVDNDKKTFSGMKHGDYFYSLKQDAAHPMGLWQRTSTPPDKLRNQSPAWETILDIDALDAAEKTNWVWRGVIPSPDQERVLVRLSRGGAVANVMREFDLKTKAFVPPSKGGFVIPEACNRVSWRDRDTLLVATDFGPGSITDSGYPRIVKEWKRGAPLSGAATIFEGKQSGMVVRAERMWGEEVILDEVNFFDMDAYVRRNGGLIKIFKPRGDSFSVFQRQLILILKRDWTVYDETARANITYPANSVVSANLEKNLAGDHGFTTIFRGGERQPVINLFPVKNHWIVQVLDDLRARIHACHFNAATGAWETVDVPVPPQPGAATSEFAFMEIEAANGPASDDIVIATQDMLAPPARFRLTLDAAQGESRGEISYRQPPCFDATGMEMRRYDAISKDGTTIPYFVATPKNFHADGGTPAILYAYGGLGVITLPVYDPAIGKGWLERGGVYVLACIRGGGEFGQKWHEAGWRENRQNSFDDFTAVARDLIARKITSPGHLGIMGKSNSGLVVAAALEQHPELYGAVVSEAPPLDMRRYTKLLVGKRWMVDIGDPDLQSDWAFLKKFSPYQNVKPAAQVKYPRVLFMASTNDDSVHPAHARKMTALMQEKGHDVLYYENTEGGHDGSANAEQRAYLNALKFTFFAKELGLKK